MKSANKIIAAALVVLAVELGVITATVLYLAHNGVTMEVNIEQEEEVAEVWSGENQQTGDNEKYL